MRFLSRRTRTQFLPVLPMLLFFACALTSCRTTPTTTAGIQTEFRALNPSRVLAVPVFILPDPSTPSVVDLALVESGRVREAYEKTILEAFKNQPGVNGISFSSVRQALGASPTVREQMQTDLTGLSKEILSADPRVRARFTKGCLNRQTFLDFYVHCVSSGKGWVTQLNALSAKVLNADTALLPFLTRLQSESERDGEKVTAGVAVLLVDTNTGKLIWGRENSLNLASKLGGGPSPTEWQRLFQSLFPEAFWADFPGRTSRG